MPTFNTNITETIQEITPMMVLSVDWESQNIVFSNNQFSEITGFSSEQLLDSNIYTYLTTDGYILFADAIETLRYSEDKVPEFGIKLLDVNGNEIDVIIYLRIHENTEGLIYLFFTDNRKQKVESQSLDVYRQIFSSTNEMMSLIDKNLVFQKVNHSYLEHFNLTEDEIIGIHVSDLHGENADLLIDNLKRTLETGEQIRIQPQVKDVLSATGMQYVDALYSPYYDDEGNITGVIVSARNITAFKTQEMQIQKKMHYYETLFQYSPDLLASINLKDGVIKECNRTLEKILGYDAGELNGEHVFQFHSQLHHAELANAIAQLKLGKMISGLEVSLVSKTNEIVDAHLRTTPLMDVDGEVAIFVWRDVRHQNKLAYKASHDPLTKLLNRSGFNEYLEKPFGDHTQKTLCYIDVDNFKSLNDRYGHLKGDEFLIGMARIFLNNLSKSDHVCRIGGDEFTILIYDLDVTFINDIMSMILDQMGQFIRNSGEYSSLDLGISIGIAELYRDEPTKVGMQRADDACYQAKRKGKNRIATFEISEKDSQSLFVGQQVETPLS